MKQLGYLRAAILAVMILFPLGAMGAQMQTQKSLSQVPITYPGDTNETIARRAQWIEGAKKEGLFVWWGTPSPAESDKIIAEFKKVYPFITVQYWRGEGEEIAAKVEAEGIGNRHDVDICLGGEPVNFPRWREKGMLEKYIDIVPKSGKEMLDKRMFGKYGDAVMPTFAPKSPQYNTNFVSDAEAPKSWEDLLAPRWKRQIGVVTDLKTWATLALGEGGWGIEKMETFLAKLKQQDPIWATGLVQGHSLLIAGEFKVLAAGNLRQAILSKQKKAPVGWIMAKPVVLVGPSLILRVKSPHPNAAKLFVEWLLSPQGLQVMANVTAQYIPGTNTQADKLMKGLPVVVETEDLVLKKIELDLEKKFANILGITLK